MGQANRLREEADDMFSLGGMPPPQNLPTFADLKMVSRTVPLKYSEFHISNKESQMIPSTSLSLSTHGIQFLAEKPIKVGALLRIWIEMSDYWSRKSKHVDYRHTQAPSYFQVLGRLVSQEQRTDSYLSVCQILNMDIEDEKVLQDFLDEVRK